MLRQNDAGLESRNGGARGSNRLPALAGEIQAAHAACSKAVVDAVQHAIEAGQRLTEAKELVAHGQWEDWLRANVPEISIRTAQRYMRAATNAAKNDTVSFSSVRRLLEMGTRQRRQKVDDKPSLNGQIDPIKHAAFHLDAELGACIRTFTIKAKPPEEVAKTAGILKRRRLQQAREMAAWISGYISVLESMPEVQP